MVSTSSQSRKIRVFLSSTFKDMNAERDYLVNYIFPQIADYCHQRALEFVPIDLRWGITEEESRNAAVLNSCLEEVNNCKPFFIGILGDRYGWTPGINELENLGLELMKEQDWLLEKVADGASITEMEIDYGVLRDHLIRHAAFFIRETDTTQSDMMEMAGSIKEKKLRTLKERIRRQKEYPVFDYNDIVSFGNTLKDQLVRMIDEEYPHGAYDTDDAIRAPHEHRLESLVTHACEDSKVTEYFNTWIKDLHKLLVVVGEQGSGTSSVLALFVKKCRNTYESDTQKILYFNFDSLAAETNPMAAFNEYMSLKSSVIAPSAWSLIVVDNVEILNQDEIEQLSDWISRQPSNVHIILGVTQGTMAYDCFYFRFQCPRITFRGYNKELIAQSSIAYLKQYGKKLSKHQIDRISEEPMLGNALNLRLTLDAIIAHGNFETLDSHITETLKDSHLGNSFWQLVRTYQDVYGKAGLYNEFAMGTIAVSLSAFGIAEKDIMAALDIPQAKWSAVRPVILRFSKGSPDSLRLARESWQKDLKLFWSTHLRARVGKSISDYLMKDPERRHKNAQTIAAIYNDIWHLPFEENNKSSSTLYSDYQESVSKFSTSFEAVMNVDPGLLSSMVLGVYKNGDSIKYDDLTGKTTEEKTEYYLRIARMLSGFNKNTMASNCYGLLADTLDASGKTLHSSFYRSMAFLEKGSAGAALDILYESGLLKTGWFRGFGYNAKSKNASSVELFLKALALEIRILSFTRKLKKLKNKLSLLMKEYDKLERESLSRESHAEILHGIALAVRTLLMFNLWSDYSEDTGIEILNKYEPKIRQSGLVSEAAYELSFARAILAYYKNDYDNLAYWSYYTLKSAGLIYGAHTNNVIILFNNRSYQYCRACNLYAIAFWHINHKYYDWNGRGYIQQFYEALPDFRTLDGTDVTRIKEVDVDIKQTADLERMWFIKAIQSIQPPKKQEELEQQLYQIENDGTLYWMSKSIEKYTKWYKYFFE